MIVNNRLRRSHSNDNVCDEGVTLCRQQLWFDAKVQQAAVLTYLSYFVFESRIPHRDRLSQEDVNCGNRINDGNFDPNCVFPSNYGSIMLSFRDVTKLRTTDGRQIDKHCTWPLRRASYKQQQRISCRSCGRHLFASLK